MFEARKQQDVVSADILGMVLASIQNAQIASENELTEEDVLSVIRKEAKKLQDAADQFTNSGNTELAKKELTQLEVISKYLPQLMSEADVEKVVAEKIAKMNVTGIHEMGRVIGEVMKELKGKADGAVVSNAVKKLLSK